MLSNSLHAGRFKVPKRKKGGSKETVFIPLPIPVLDSNNKNVEVLSQTLPGQYSASLRNKRIYVENEYEAKILFNCGYFGKGEFSRGDPCLNKPLIAESKHNSQETGLDEEYSLNIKNLASISNEKFETVSRSFLCNVLALQFLNCLLLRYANKSEWSKLKTNEKDCKESNEFHLQFLGEFVNKYVKIDDLSASNLIQFCKIKFDDKFENIQFLNNDDSGEQAKSSSKNSLFKTWNSPFGHKIKQFPSNSQVEEFLNLMYEEAFFLCFGLDCLTVRDSENNSILTSSSLWKKFVELDSQFPFKYAVYHKLRSKGWIIKNGLKYGCDFLAYFEGPDRYHASYSIRVKPKDLYKLDQELSSDSDKLNDQDEEISQFCALVRINETASKELLLCYVLYDSETICIDGPMCLKQMNVMEIFVNRWVPNENRGETEEETEDKKSHGDKKAMDKQDNRIENLFKFFDSD